MNVQKLDDNVYYYTDLATNEEIDLIMDLVKDESNWYRVYDQGSVYDPKRDPDAEKSQNILIASRKNFIDLSQREVTPESKIFDRVFKEATEHYRLDKGITGAGELPPFTHVDRHSIGSTYRTHVDTAPIEIESYTVLLYVNDDYAGGELSFSLFKGGEKTNNGVWDDSPVRGTYPPDHDNNKDLIDFWVKPAAMSIIIFPPLHPYPHTAHEIKSGTKYMVKGFWMLKDQAVTAWSSNPYDKMNEQDILRINPEGFPIGGTQHQMMKDGIDIVPNEWKVKKY